MIQDGAVIISLSGGGTNLYYYSSKKSAVSINNPGRTWRIDDAFFGGNFTRHYFLLKAADAEGW